MTREGAEAPPEDAMLDRVASAAAQQKAMERGGKSLPHGSSLFYVEQGWEAVMLSRDKKVITARTLLELEQALREPQNKIILIPLGALMSEGDIEKLCHRNAIVKTLFKEVGKHG